MIRRGEKKMEFAYNEKILSVKDLEVQFKLRGQTLTAIRGNFSRFIQRREPCHSRRVRIGKVGFYEDFHGNAR